MKSIMQKKSDGECYLCRLLHDDYDRRENLEEHHVFGGANRHLSEKYGLKVYLCAEHHRTSKEAVHQNSAISLELKQRAQKAFMDKYPYQDFISVFGKNYLY